MTGPPSEFRAFRAELMADNPDYLGVFDKGDGTAVILARSLFTYGLLHCVIGDAWGYGARYCYATPGKALTAALVWIESGAAEPEGWHRALDGRRRPDGDKAREYFAP